VTCPREVVITGRTFPLLPLVLGPKHSDIMLSKMRSLAPAATRYARCAAGPGAIQSGQARGRAGA
jgi:hypothetical protein